MMQTPTSPGPATPFDPETQPAAQREAVSAVLNNLLADVFALYLKTKSVHWHISGNHFRDYHLLLDEHASELFGMTDVIAERVRKIGGTTLRSIRHVQRLQSIPDNDGGFEDPGARLAELLRDNQHLVRMMIQAHRVCDQHNDVATASILETSIDDGERRVWFLREICTGGNIAT